MLDKVLKRLKIPQSFCNIIRNLFTNRKNRIFTAVGLTDKYDVLIGIDQGEVISPLLWCIQWCAKKMAICTTVDHHCVTSSILVVYI